MADALFLIITVAFFAASAGFVRLCDKVIGPDADHAGAQGRGEPEVAEPPLPARKLETAGGAR